jgi:uncharacterized protein (TIGR03067 family)/prepilin-type processing-associated H-X9-DG protein
VELAVFGGTTSNELAKGARRAMHTTQSTLSLLAVTLLTGLGIGLGLSSQPGLQAADVQGKEAAQKTDEQRLVGTWRITKGREDGKDIAAELCLLTRLTFAKDGKWTMTLIDESKELRFKFAAPGQIDVTLFSRGDFTPGIYKFEGDNRLTLCIGFGGKRPIALSVEKDEGQVLLVLERAKPGEEKLTPQEVAKYKDAVDKVRQAAAQTMSTNNLKQIGLAIHSYHDAYKKLPTHAIYSKDGKTPLLSWRVTILPYVEAGALYQEFKLDEAWDSPHNKKLIAKIPPVYAAPTGPPDKTGAGLTYYQVFTGPDTLFDGTNKMTLVQITDGTSNTILALEAKDPVLWTKPDDLVLPKEKDKMPAVGGLFKNGMNVLFCDASVQFLRRDLPGAVLRALVTPRGGETVDFDQLLPKK